MLYKLLFIAMLLASCTSCASIATWHYSDPALASFLQKRHTHCDALPRIYSGLYFDYCWLNSDPQRIYGSAPMALLLIDAFLSSITDTIALPVTAIQQREHGSIPLARARIQTVNE